MWERANGQNYGYIMWQALTNGQNYGDIMWRALTNWQNYGDIMWQALTNWQNYDDIMHKWQALTNKLIINMYWMENNMRNTKFRSWPEFNPLIHMTFQRSSALQSSDEHFEQSRKL